MVGYKIKRLNEYNSYDERKALFIAFVEENLSYLTDKGFEIESEGDYADAGSGDFAINIIKHSNVKFNWNEVKDYIIPFLQIIIDADSFKLDDSPIQFDLNYISSGRISKKEIDYEYIAFNIEDVISEKDPIFNNNLILNSISIYLENDDRS